MPDGRGSSRDVEDLVQDLYLIDLEIVWYKKRVNAKDLYSFLDNQQHEFRYYVVDRFFTNNLQNEADADWLGEAVEFEPKLAWLKNSKGERVIDCAVPACMHKMMQAGLHRAMNAKAEAKVKEALTSMPEVASVTVHVASWQGMANGEFSATLDKKYVSGGRRFMSRKVAGIGNPVSADRLYAHLLENTSSIGGFFEHNLKNKDDANWLREAVEFTPALAGLTYTTRDVSSRPAESDKASKFEVNANFAIRYAAKECQEEMHTGLRRAIEAMSKIPEPSKDDLAAAKSDHKPGTGMHVVLSTRHMDRHGKEGIEGKEGYYFDISMRVKEALKAMGCTVYNPNTDNHRKDGWLLSFSNDLYHAAQTKGFVYQLQQHGKERDLSQTQLAEEHMGREWEGRLPVIGASIPTLPSKEWQQEGDSSKGMYPDHRLQHAAWRAIHCAKRQWRHLVLPVVEFADEHFE